MCNKLSCDNTRNVCTRHMLRNWNYRTMLFKGISHSTFLVIFITNLQLQQYCKEVFGVELIADAIEDARYNASANNITNCEFFAGNCDDYIQSLVHKATGENIVAIVDPPRAGLRKLIVM